MQSVIKMIIFLLAFDTDQRFEADTHGRNSCCVTSLDHF